MKRLTIIFIYILCFHNLKASPQDPDFLIIGKDTVELYFLPLENLDSTKLKEFHKTLISNKGSIYSSLNLWREYQALWRLEDNKLYLVGLKNNPNSEKILKATFGEKYKNGKILASWFSSRLAIPKSKLLRWNELFSRTYLKEEIFDFESGVLKNRELVDNYIHLENGIDRRDQYQLENFIAKEIKKLNRPKLCFRYWITIDEKGKISEIQTDRKIFELEMPKTDYTTWINLFKEQFKNMQFDLIKWNGKPYKETIFMEIFRD
jgi:hypothetical protein